jgi:hypothetical protein
MSADNWGTCPQCKAGKMYPFEKSNLREDYEVGFDSRNDHLGEFYFYYSAECYDCGFKFKREMHDKL